MSRPPWNTNFSDADSGSVGFVGISKRKWINAYLKLDDDDPANQCFKKIGEYPILPELINGELAAMVKALEIFLCHGYSTTGPVTLPSLRWELFQSENLGR